jgi:hypothetical protein
MEAIVSEKAPSVLTGFPGDDIRQMMWCFVDRYELHTLVQSVRGVAH